MNMRQLCHTFAMTPALSAVTGTLAASLVLHGARPVDSGLSVADWLPGLIFLAVVLGAISACVQPRRHREAPLRREMRARPVTFRTQVEVRQNALGPWQSGGGPCELTVHGDMFKVSNVFPLAWFLFGQQWCYRADDTTMEAVLDRRHDWIEIVARHRPDGPRIRLARKRMNREIWDALVQASVHALGTPPL